MRLLSHMGALAFQPGSVHVPDEFRREVLPRKDSQHPVRNSRGQEGRPLVHRLIGDAHRISGGSGSASEQFNGFGLEHGPN